MNFNNTTAPVSWHCELHRTWNFGDCPVCDDDMAAVTAMDEPKPANECASCHVPLEAGDAGVLAARAAYMADWRRR